QALLDITAAEGSIVTNAGNISANLTAIGSNDVDIAANLALINTNITDIAANVTAIGLRALADASPTNNEMLKQDGSGDLVGAGFLAAAVVLLTGAQTLASKTLTAPVLNGAITGDAMTTDLSASADSDELAFADAIKSYIDAQMAALGIVRLGSGTVSGGNLDLIWTNDSYKKIMFTCSNLAPQAFTDFTILFGNSGGFLVGAADYAWQRVAGDPITLTDLTPDPTEILPYSEDGSDNIIPTGIGFPSGSSNVYGGLEITIFDPADTSRYMPLIVHGVMGTGSTPQGGILQAQVVEKTAIDRIRIEGGTMTAGNIIAWGFK
ncbi:MAG: hypothetical protein KAJ10_11745, partial [Thermodesulfovibrionia bacterium]|nr:hypothetical protein [Thermodesulfovibrionia bacterium]